MASPDRPYVDDGQLRTFDEAVDPNELKWHWDEEDRSISPTHDTNWKFQFDNELPRDLIQHIWIFIPAGTWHRLHKGTNSLTLRIIKCPTKV